MTNKGKGKGKESKGKQRGDERKVKGNDGMYDYSHIDLGNVNMTETVAIKR